MRSSDDSAGMAPSDLTGIEIIYQTLDRFEHQHADPNIAHAERIGAELTGIDYETERRVALGSVSLVRIDLWEVADRWFDVLDAESAEWAAYHDIVSDSNDEDRFLLIVDRAEIVEWARGHDIGLHAVARAIRTWGEDALIVLTAFPPGGSGPQGEAGGKALARHWARLGLDRVPGSRPPMLTGTGNSRQVGDAVEKLSVWSPPTPTV